MWSSLDLSLAHFLLFIMAVFIVTPKKAPLYPMIVWLGMIICSGLIMCYYWDKKPLSKFTRSSRKNHNKTQRVALLSSLLFLLTCISVKINDYIGINFPIALMTLTAVSIIYTLISHIKHIDNKEKIITQRVRLAVKYSWVIVSLISYYLARSLTANSWDIPFDSTFNKLITIITALLFIFVFYYSIYFIAIAILASLAPQTRKTKKRLPFNSNHSLSIFAPLFIIGYISYIAFNIQTLSIIKFGFEFAIKYDTRDTFFCNNQYMFLDNYPDAHYMFISDGNYRALIPRGDELFISRLSCTNSEPFYSLVSVEDKKGLRISALEKRATALADDLKVIRLTGPLKSPH